MKRKRYGAAIALLLAMLLILGGCGGSENDATKGAAEESASSQADSSPVLTISSDKGETVYTLAELQALGMETHQYSGRNKEQNNERQVREYTGVLLEKLLKDAGIKTEGAILKVTCSDGYAREYEMDNLSELYFFDGEDAKKGEAVPPMLAVISEGDNMGNDKIYHKTDGSPLRLVYGQADYDSDYTKDFNMQGWACYVETIEVESSDE